MDDNNFKKNYSMQTLHRAIQILRAFSTENKMLSLTELHNKTGLSKSSLQRLLSTLVFEGILQKNEETKKYQLGIELLFLGNLVEKNSSLLSIANPIMKSISEEIGETVSLSVIEENRRKCIGTIQSKYELQAKVFVGQESPLNAGASAKVLLAFLPEEDLVKYLREIELPKLTDNTITSKDELLDELSKISDQGFAISYGERLKGIIAISAPIFDPFNEILASLTVVIPTARFEEYKKQVLIDLIKNGASTITQKIKTIN
ncbi:IclR family KDG regulon transcriptional repressor [Neobacillus niacini]|uniref:IclR family transcriptional regulator n=1 Tax=Neobacillus niacini TaxID=86668 RepID=UPI002781A646|nr:IclR family transcriptional regulator [Neobacillus niacini]MDQ1002172.1 IclR family KDG regulon transcriptional repressor [Neobacillus niacini]